MSEKRITEENRYAGLALAEEELVARVAWCYYHDGLTQNDIGERLGLPRLKISRLLEKGRQSGVIRVQINSRYEGCLALESELQQRFGLKIARVLPALNTPPMNTRLGIGAAQSLMGILQPGQLLAVGFGEATMSCLQHLSGFIGSQQVRLVTLSGGVGPYMTGIGQLDAACSVSIIPAPLRVSFGGGRRDPAPRVERARRDPRGDGGGRGGSRHWRHRSAARRDHSALRLYQRGRTADVRPQRRGRRHFRLFPAGRRQAGRRTGDPSGTARRDP